MKIGKYRDTEYLHLLVETIEDVRLYAKIFGEISVKENMGLLLGYQSQNFRKNINDYLVHEGVNTSAMMSAFAVTLSLKNKETIPIIEVCQISDDLIMKKIDGMINYYYDGLISRVNQKGGYCSITQEEMESDYAEFIEIDEANQKVLTNFLLNKDLYGEDFKITSETVIIENSREPWKEFIKELNNRGLKDFQILPYFKSRTILYTDADFYNLLQGGIDRGLKNVCFTTTGQDLHQLRKFPALLEKIHQANSGLRLNFYISTYSQKVIEMFKDLKFINVILIKE